MFKRLPLAKQEGGERKFMLKMLKESKNTYIKKGHELIIISACLV